jgi:hypothetical protein
VRIVADLRWVENDCRNSCVEVVLTYMALKNNLRLGEQVWSKMPKVNAELLTLTYGSLMVQVFTSCQDAR